MYINIINMSYIKVFCPDNKKYLLEDKKRQAAHKNKWKKIIYYERRQKKICFPDQLVNLQHEKLLTGCASYKQDTFYKIGSMSYKDPIWDYYRVLKPTKKKMIAQESCKSLLKHKFNTKKKEINKVTIIHATKEDPYIVDFS